VTVRRRGAGYAGVTQTEDRRFAVTGPEHEGVERGAAEERSGAPLTPTEEEASKRPPSDQDPDSGPGAGLDGGGRYGDDG
jgi:hypothetical protein